MEINNILGMKFESIQYYELLIKNFPTNTWTKQSIKIIKSYEKK